MTLLPRLVPGVMLIASGFLGYLYALYANVARDAAPGLVIQASDKPAEMAPPPAMPSVIALEEAAHIYATDLISVKESLAKVLAQLKALREQRQVAHVIVPGWETTIERSARRYRPAGILAQPPCRCPKP